MVNKELNIEHICTKIHINRTVLCKNCPISIYAKDNDKVQLGVGNIYAKTLLVLPPYDIKAKIKYETILNLTIKAYNEITGQNLLEDCYVTRYVKCYNKTDFNMDNQSFDNCLGFLSYEIAKINPSKIIYFGRDWWEKINNVEQGLMNPGILYYDNQELKNRFMKEFKEAIYST